GPAADRAALRCLAGQFEDGLLPWMFWAYQVIVPDQERPLTAEAIVSQELLGTLVRPYPMAITGVPTRIAFHPDTSTFELEYTTRRLGGGHFPRRLETVVFVPARHYPDGYRVQATGARIVSKPCATQLGLRTRRPGRPVSVRVTPRTGGVGPRCPPR